MLPEYRRIEYCDGICENIKDENNGIDTYQNLAKHAPNKTENAILLANSADEKKHFELLQVLSNSNNCNCKGDS